MAKQTSKSNAWSREGMMAVGQIFRQAREQKQWTLRQLEAECGLKASRVNRLENGLRVNPDFPTMQQLLEVLKPLNFATGQTFTVSELEIILQQPLPKPTVLRIPAPELDYRASVQVCYQQSHHETYIERRFFDVDRQEWLYCLDGLPELFSASNLDLIKASQHCLLQK